MHATVLAHRDKTLPYVLAQCVDKNRLASSLLEGRGKEEEAGVEEHSSATAGRAKRQAKAERAKA